MNQAARERNYIGQNVPVGEHVEYLICLMNFDYSTNFFCIPGQEMQLIMSNHLEILFLKFQEYREEVRKMFLGQEVTNIIKNYFSKTYGAKR